MSKISDVFKDLDAAIKANPDQAKRINGVYQWVIDGKDYIMDLKSMSAGEGKAPKPEVTLTISEKDFVDLMTGHALSVAIYVTSIQTNIRLLIVTANSCSCQARLSSRAPCRL